MSVNFFPGQSSTGFDRLPAGGGDDPAPGGTDFQQYIYNNVVQAYGADGVIDWYDTRDILAITAALSGSDDAFTQTATTLFSTGGQENNIYDHEGITVVNDGLKETYLNSPPFEDNQQHHILGAVFGPMADLLEWHPLTTVAYELLGWRDTGTFNAGDVRAFAAAAELQDTFKTDGKDAVAPFMDDKLLIPVDKEIQDDRSLMRNELVADFNDGDVTITPFATSTGEESASSPASEVPVAPVTQQPAGSPPGNNVSHHEMVPDAGLEDEPPPPVIPPTVVISDPEPEKPVQPARSGGGGGRAIAI